MFILSACSSKKTTESEDTAKQSEAVNPDMVDLSESQYKSVGIQLGSVTDKNLSNFVKASGTIEVLPQQSISITSPYGGIITTMNIVEGKFIKKGEIIASIENPEFVQIQQDYMESSSQLTFLKQDLARQEELVKENIAARKSLQRASSEYNSIAARVEGLKAKLRMINIDPSSIGHGNFTSKSNLYSPQSGYVTKIYTNIGKFVSANETIGDLANTDNMIVRVRVFEKDIHNLVQGQKIRFKATGDSSEHTATVSLIGKDIHEDRTMDVQARINSGSTKLLPGMFVNVILEFGTSTTPALPEEAIVQAAGKSYIFIEEAASEANEKHKDSTANGSAKHIAFRRVEVQTGVTENGFTAVTLADNFDKKAKVVLKGAYDLLSKMNNSEEEE